MKASLKFLILGFLMLVPFATAHAQAPSLSPIANMSLNAGATATVNVVAVDVGGRPIALTASLPPFATLNQPTNGTGSVVTTLTLAPGSANVGNYTAAVTATAGGVANVKIFQIIVNAAGSDQAPVVDAPALQEVTAGANTGFTVNASDADGDAIASLDVSGLPFGATFTQSASNTMGTFNWTPTAGDAGEYDLTFTASNSLSGAAVTHIRVKSAPTLTIHPIDDVTLAEGGSISVPIDVSGLPGTLVILTASLPSFGTLNPPGMGTGGVSTTITLSPPAGSAGTYHASVTATSDVGTMAMSRVGAPTRLGMSARARSSVSVTETFDIIVTGSTGGGNHAPVLSAPTTQTVAEGFTLNFDVTATDADGDPVALVGSALPPGSTFHDNGDNTGTFMWTPVSGQAGTYTASFSGNDGHGGSGSASTEITVTGPVTQNHAPTLSAPSTQSVDEGVNLSFQVTASDPDGDHVALSANSVPSGATFSDQGTNSGTFSWTPGSTQSGVYNVTFAGDDGHGGAASAATTITVNDVGGGGIAEVPGKACLIGDFQTCNQTTCFRIRPVNGSFDLRNVDLSSIRLEFHGHSIAALDGKAEIEVVCHGGGGGGGGGGNGGGGDGHHGDGRNDRRGHWHRDGALALLCWRHPHGDDDDHDCGISCDDEGQDNEGGECGTGNGECDTLGIRACFSTRALLVLFAGATLPCDLANADIRATLTSGGTVVATFAGKKHEDEDKDKGGHGGRDTRGLNPKARPNPLNPITELSFTMSSEGRVRVKLYDTQGRLVNTLLDEVRGVGPQKVVWDGSNAQGAKVASGVYFFLIQAPDGNVIQRVSVVK